MKRLTVLSLVLCSLTAWGQKEVKPTNEFVVSGLVKQEITVTLADLGKFPAREIGDMVITNHLGEKRGTAKGLRGVLLKDVLKDIQFKEENPKLLSEFYLTCIASDNYKVLYSWNELFNSPTGDNVYVITEKEGKKLEDMDERILVLTPTDYKTGRRNIKGLSKIHVDQVD